MIHTAAVLVVSLIVAIKEISCNSNPCPEVFQFKSKGQINYGIITIPPPGIGLTILKLEIAIRDPNQGEKTKLKLLKSLDETVQDAARGQDIQFIFNFPQSRQLPYIEKITLNNRVICQGPKILNIYKFRHEYKIENPVGATQLSHIPYRQPTPSPISHEFYQATTVEPDYPIKSDPYGNPWLPGYPINPDPEGNPWIINRYPTTSAAPVPPSTPSSTPRPVPPRPSPPPTTPVSHPVTPRPSPSVLSIPVKGPQADNGSWLASLSSAKICGRTSAVQPTHLIIGGIEVTLGEFPWMVAMFHYDGRSIDFKCGASLISNTYVITAAHCTKNQLRVHLEFGRYNISNYWEVDYTYRASTKIIEHPEYVSGAHNDVALISFDRVEFTPRIQPICLWASGTNLDNILMRSWGTVTGWGVTDNDGTSATIPMKLNVSMVGLDTCRSSQDNLRNIASNKTFCAGGQRKGPCHGDSGSGFYFRHGKVWYLRGIVSTSLGTAYTCNVDEYAVYADVAYFLDWMRPYLLS